MSQATHLSPEQTDFQAMRAGLVERGLLTEDYRLTCAGDCFARELIEDLAEAEAPCEPERPRVRWNFTWKRARA